MLDAEIDDQIRNRMVTGKNRRRHSVGNVIVPASLKMEVMLGGIFLLLENSFPVPIKRPFGIGENIEGFIDCDNLKCSFGVSESSGPAHDYPGETGLNPDGSGRRIHVMKTNDGEIWFRNNYYFELEPGAGTLTGNCDFRIVGGTKRFRNASGSVFCQVVTRLGDVTVDEEGDVIAPFRYDFTGFIDLEGN